MSDRNIAVVAWSIVGAVSTVLAIAFAHAAELVRAGVAVLAVFGGGVV